jgi:hypothetical protein
MFSILLITVVQVASFVAHRPRQLNFEKLATRLSETSGDSLSLWECMIDRFQGDFDNYNQVVEDRRQHLLPREGGGHEHIHCTLISLSKTVRLVAFYLDAMPQRIFRFRYYELQPPTSNGSKQTMEMRLYTLHPDLELLLRAQSEDPLSWPSIFESFEMDDSSLGPLQKVIPLPKCEVSWSVEMDDHQHAYATSAMETDGVHAVMVHDEAIVDSQVTPGKKIRILDQLSLYPDVFYINDRGFDPETGAFIYGNQRGVPYRLERVTKCEQGERQVINSSLKWTLGSNWSEEAEYDEKMSVIGGPSSRLNTNKK